MCIRDRNQSVAARYYSAYKDGDEYPVECYIYKLDSTDKWTAYIIENDVTILLHNYKNNNRKRQWKDYDGRRTISS